MYKPFTFDFNKVLSAVFSDLKNASHEGRLRKFITKHESAQRTRLSTLCRNRRNRESKRVVFEECRYVHDRISRAYSNLSVDRLPHDREGLQELLD